MLHDVKHRDDVERPIIEMQIRCARLVHAHTELATRIRRCPWIWLNPDPLVTSIAREREKVTGVTPELEQLAARLIALDPIKYVQEIIDLAVLLLQDHGG